MPDSAKNASIPNRYKIKFMYDENEVSLRIKEAIDIYEKNPKNGYNLIRLNGIYINKEGCKVLCAL